MLHTDIGRLSCTRTDMHMHANTCVYMYVLHHPNSYIARYMESFSIFSLLFNFTFRLSSAVFSVIAFVEKYRIKEQESCQTKF